MRTLTAIISLFIVYNVSAQDTTISKPVDTTAKPVDTLPKKSVPASTKKPVMIFNSDRAINAQTPQTVGRGNLAFKVSHNFGDIGGNFGGLKNFFGLDNAVDTRIGFELGVGDNFDLIAARCKGASLRNQQWELGMKWRLIEQAENGAPLSLAIFINHVVATNAASSFSNRENSYKGFTERSSNAFQLIIAKRFGNVSLQLNPTVVTRGYSMSYDQGTMFALGGAMRVPIVQNKLNLLVDYFHPFRQEAVEDSFKVRDNIEFHDPLGIGLEIITGGHHFRLNFTNATEILENRFIPRTITSWGDGRFRWSFTISRTFRIWYPK